MSDCSTEAMKPKEQPRTCGTCEHAFNKDIPCCVPVIGCEDIRAFYREVGCNHYKERKDTSEQRYQQLEQVAKEMFSCLYKALMRPDGVPPDGLIDEAEYLSYRLIRLGVSLDG